MPLTQSIPCGAPVTILQNVAYALPSKRHILGTSANVEVSSTTGGPWVAFTTPGETTASFVRCTTGMCVVTAKSY